MASKNIDRILKLPLKHSFFLFGPRQVGKTTLIKNSFGLDSCLIYDLLIPEELRRLKMNPGRFRDEIIYRDSKYTHVFIDEVQKLPEILDEIHYLLENMKKPPAFILSGSSARKLKRSNANMLGGRAFSFSLFGLTHLELMPSSKFSLYRSLEFGSLPAIYLLSMGGDENAEVGVREQSQDAILALRSYVNTYIKEEIQMEALVRNLDAFTEFLKLAADENTNVLNYSNIASDIGVSSATVKEYYQILEDTLLGFYLRPYSSRLRKKLSKHPKFYFFDTGVARALQQKLSLELTPKTKEFGKAFEHFVIKEFIYTANYLNPDYKFSYYRTENNAEVDLIIEAPTGKVFAVEVKASDTPKNSELKGLKSFKTLVPKASLICASLAEKRYKLDEDIWVYPWQEVFDVVFKQV
jgi:predicted AAA+ superfamily ATPase